jgi:5-formyltetrahydrofolate cyclo-ligase
MLDVTAIAEKTALRKLAALRRAEAHAADPEAAAARLRDVGVAALGERRFAVVSGYAPIKSEIDPRPLMLALAGRGAVLALPVIVGPGALVFRRWQQSDRMAAGRMGIAEPEEAAEVVEPDLLLVPLLAFDGRRNRIGYGAAHYDATIAGLRRRKTIVTVGVAYAAQAVDAVPVEPWDERLDLVVTDRGVV